MSQPYLTILEVAGRLQCSRATVYRLIADGDLKSVKVRGSRRITPASFDRYERRIMREAS